MRLRPKFLHLRFPAKGIPTLASIAISLTTQMIWWATPAQAQSFLQQLFGIGPTQPQVRYIPPPSRLAPRTAPVAIHGLPHVAPRFDREPARQSVSPEGSGSYTTVCVRMCDGFHFPISHRVQRSRFYRDADACRSRCGLTEARLFYHPSSGSNANMKSAMDVSGRSYADLPTAFLHRKKLVSGCGCRPEPWSDASTRRHQGYALAEGQFPPSNTGQSPGSVTVVAGSYSTGPVSQPDIARKSDGGDIASATPNDAAEAIADAHPAPSVAASARPRRTAHATSTRQNSGQRAAHNSARQPPSARASRQALAPAPRKQAANAVVASNKMQWPGDPPTRTR